MQQITPYTTSKAGSEEAEEDPHSPQSGPPRPSKFHHLPPPPPPPLPPPKDPSSPSQSPKQPSLPPSSSSVIDLRRVFRVRRTNARGTALCGSDRTTFRGGAMESTLNIPTAEITSTEDGRDRRNFEISNPRAVGPPNPSPIAAHASISPTTTPLLPLLESLTLIQETKARKRNRRGTCRV